MAYLCLRHYISYKKDKKVSFVGKFDLIYNKVQVLGKLLIPEQNRLQCFNDFIFVALKQVLQRIFFERIVLIVLEISQFVLFG